MPPPGCWGFGGGAAGGPAQSQGALRASPRGRDWSQGSEALAWGTRGVRGTRNSVHLPVSGSSFRAGPSAGVRLPFAHDEIRVPRK